jgi:2-isopropylmalate synthase
MATGARSRDDDMEVTFEALRGAKKAIYHYYLATAPFMRERVLHMSVEEQVSRAQYFAEQFLRYRDQFPETVWTPEFSPEMFTQTECGHALSVVNAVVSTLAPHCDRIIINLPATVEVGMPREYGNLIEWMHDRIEYREKVVLSAHPHNDRGTAVAAAECALLAGADRVEGCLFGNGERAGNLDVFNLAMNFYVHGRDPGLDFSHLDEIVEVYEEATGLRVSERHPYAGALAFKSMSGTHQDAILKIVSNMNPDGSWRGVAYNNIDPHDLGRDFEAVAITSQSGSGGIGYILRKKTGITFPKALLREFSLQVQSYIRVAGGGDHTESIWPLFVKEYLDQSHASIMLEAYQSSVIDRACTVVGKVRKNGQGHRLEGSGGGHVDAFVQGLRKIVGDFDVKTYEEHALSSGAGADALALVELLKDGQVVYGVGVSQDTLEASFRAILSALNRAG